MVEKAVLRTDEKIVDSVIVKVAGARAGGVPSQQFAGEIAALRKAPAAVFCTCLTPEDDVFRVHYEVGLAVAVPVGNAELAPPA